jgi:hypothetical protein
MGWIYIVVWVYGNNLISYDISYAITNEFDVGCYLCTVITDIANIDVTIPFIYMNTGFVRLSVMTNVFG